MANVRSINIEKNQININLSVSKQEYEILKQATKDIILLPTDQKILNEVLTTGKLGNSNRIMLPKKLLKREEIPKLDKKVSAKIFKIDGKVFLLAKLREDKPNIPIFKEK